MARDEPITSPLQRFIKLGSLVGRVGASVVGSRTLHLTLQEATRQARRTENLIKNASRIVETLGEMKGAAMKVGQMLSLHEGLLPPEVAEVLRSLQREAPRVPAEVMRYEVEGSLGGKIEELFAEFEGEAYAAASIGQVHLGRLHDGRRVAVKVQYPAIDQIVKADLGNLKRLFAGLFGLMTDLDFEPIWRELRDRLLEELDYTREAQNMRQMAGLYHNVPEILIPGVIDERSSNHVLTMEYLDGISPDDACSNRYTAEHRNAWGAVIFEFMLRGLLEFRYLHADPNLANFAFLEDGRVIVYDFGCTKRIPEPIAAGYASIFLACLDGRADEIPEVLRKMGVHQAGTPLPGDLVGPYVDLFSEILRDDPPYAFGEDADLYQKLMDLGMSNWSRAMNIQFPEDIIFIDRTLGGHFGNLSRLRSTAAWSEMVRRYATSALGSEATR
jgi:predicted unusual protein kinase regulating ubiquinone biosynthesis (AarF/ABC1/UbiB family)